MAAKRHAPLYLEGAYGVSERRADRLLACHRSSKRRRPGHMEQAVLDARIQALSARYLRWGYRKICALLKAEQCRISREMV